VTFEKMQYNAYIKLVNDINILHFENSPGGIDIQYGDENVRKLCEKFFQTKRCVISDNLKPLMKAVSTHCICQ
jgi:hypothetical protein